MAVVASITFIDPSPVDAVLLANDPQTCPVDTLYCVAGVLGRLGYPAPVSPEVAEAAIDALLGVVTGLSALCWRQGDQALADGIEDWLAARGRF